jgi:hypothetical protein
MAENLTSTKMGGDREIRSQEKMAAEELHRLSGAAPVFEPLCSKGHREEERGNKVMNLMETSLTELRADATPFCPANMVADKKENGERAREVADAASIITDGTSQICGA